MASALVSEWSSGLQVSRDLTDAAENNRVLDIASKILKSGLPIDSFKEACYGDEEGKNAGPPVLIAAVGSAESKAKLGECGPFHLSCVFAMYGEQNRIATRDAHPNGQDFLRMKVRQLRWLFDGETDKTWELLAVDDGDPNDSKGLAREIIEAEGWTNVRVLDLEDAVKNQIPYFIERGLTAGCKESRKGGAILYGLYMAASEAAVADDDKLHLTMYTDSDLSTDMSLCGSLAAGILKKGGMMSMGARYGAPGTFLVKPPDGGASGHPMSHYEQPNMMKIVFRHYIRVRLLPMLQGIYDTQCAFKMFRASDIPPVIKIVRSIGADFDMELLLCALTYFKRNRKDGQKLCSICPTLFTEDFAESNFMGSAGDPDAPYRTYAGMCQALAEMHERYVPADSDEALEVKKLAEFCRSLDWETYKKMILNLESELGPTLFDYDFGSEAIKKAAS